MKWRTEVDDRKILSSRAAMKNNPRHQTVTGRTKAEDKRMDKMPEDSWTRNDRNHLEETGIKWKTEVDDRQMLSSRAAMKNTSRHQMITDGPN
ncbi:hypothetical protein BaRGS_00007752 [Batillaria attramentaria]|uniref:Uncharacterized protein n=1 Tax=Batillaria attramentaria TaxID=370345 RepID=A0ABD0LNG8_9CAEN